MKHLDENDRLIAGTLPEKADDDAVPYEPHLVDAGAGVSPLHGQPSSPAAETALLMSAIQNNRLIDDLTGTLKTDAFYVGAHQRIWEAILDIHRVGQPVDMQTVAAWLTDRNRIESVGGTAYLEKIAECRPNTFNVQAYASIVVEKAMRRKIIAACKASESLCNRPQPLPELLDKCEQLMYTATRDYLGNEPTYIGHLVLAEDERNIRIQNGLEKDAEMCTGFAEIDRLMGGLREGETTLIGAWTGSGKTAFASSIALSVAFSNVNNTSRGVLFFSIEMTKQQLARRSMSTVSEITYSKIKDGALSPSEYTRMVDRMRTLIHSPIMIVEDTNVTPTKVAAQIRRAISRFDKPKGEYGTQQKLSLVIIDYIQLMDSDSKHNSDYVKFSEIARLLAQLARELRIHIIVLSQLSADAVNSKVLECPQVHHISKSKDIASHMQNIIMFHRPHRFASSAAHAAETSANAQDYVEVALRKCRDREPGFAKLRFIGEITKFTDPTEDDLLRWSRAGAGHRGKA